MAGSCRSIGDSDGVDRVVATADGVVLGGAVEVRVGVVRKCSGKEMVGAGYPGAALMEFRKALESW